jgi:hypothetical protein
MNCTRSTESDTLLREIIANCHKGGAYQIPEVYAFRDHSDDAFEWLDRAYVERDAGLVAMKVDPLLKSLHSDPQFAPFLKKLNLPT